MKIDLRSDTVTRPTPGMLDAICKAEVGDDVFGEDPTINALEERAAKMFGKEAGLFCPSGTMTNQIAINVLTKPGDEVVCDYTSHIYQYEGGGIARNSGVQAKLLTGDRGRISATQVEESINQIFDWLTRTKLVSIENTVNKAGGSFYTLQQMKDLSEVCHRNGLLMHLDGARIFNAVIEAGYTPAQIGPLFNSISVCMSKGLGAPAGSLLLGTKDFIREARRARKVFGGGMRQAGYFAAAGLYALDNHIDRLKEDHRRAKVLAEAINKLPYIKELLPVETNILIFTLHDAIPLDYFMEILNDNGIQCAIFGKQTVRFVTHLDIDDNMIDKTISVLKKIN
ncbi:MAG: aminotransferase class I/II-fold pyridoxal phosphate-dependent enzyme [Bacteroidia bacterium]|nr:aminotransferase class I/II-fold pyridoxal phosphate-dependent enzyme [Bacteroidia bacterium]